MPDGVADSAKVQRRILERIASGSMPLPLPSGTVAEGAESDAPIEYHSGGRAYPDGLANY